MELLCQGAGFSNPRSPGLHHKSLYPTNWFSSASWGSGNVEECVSSMHISPIFYVQWSYGVDIIFLFLQTHWVQQRAGWVIEWRNRWAFFFFLNFPCLVQYSRISYCKIISFELKNWIFTTVSWGWGWTGRTLVSLPTLKFNESVFPQLEHLTSWG